MDEGDRSIWQLDTRIYGSDGGIVPVLHLAQIDVGEELAGETELTRGDAIEVHDGHYRTDHYGKLGQPVARELLGQ